MAINVKNRKQYELAKVLDLCADLNLTEKDSAMLLIAAATEALASFHKMPLSEAAGHVSEGALMFRVELLKLEAA